MGDAILCARPNPAKHANKPRGLNGTLGDRRDATNPGGHATNPRGLDGTLGARRDAANPRARPANQGD
eukprot:11198049-Lingulodinium_polyedra.AAC.1